MKFKLWISPAISIAAAILLLLGVSNGLAEAADSNAEKELQEMMATLLPGSTSFAEEAYEDEDEAIKAVYKGETGYVIQTVTYGYAGDVVLLVGVNNDGKVTGLVVRELSETHGLGANALSDVEFMSQFLNTSGEAQIGDTIEAISGATVTSKAITKGVNAAVGFVTGADTSSGATTWGG